MARNLLKAGHQVAAFDLVPAALAPVTAAGATAAASAAAAAAGADFVITMLPAGRHVRDAWIGSHGMAAASAPGATADRLLDDRCRQRPACGRRWRRPARWWMRRSPAASAAPGRHAHLHGRRHGRCLRQGPADPRADGQEHRALRRAGAGQAAKICNNMILGVTMIVVAEAFVLAEKLGLSHQALFDVVSTSSGQCWALTNYCPVPGPVPTSPPTATTRRASRRTTDGRRI